MFGFTPKFMLLQLRVESSSMDAGNYVSSFFHLKFSGGTFCVLLTRLVVSCLRLIMLYSLNTIVLSAASFVLR